MSQWIVVKICGKVARCGVVDSSFANMEHIKGAFIVTSADLVLVWFPAIYWKASRLPVVYDSNSLSVSVNDFDAADPLRDWGISVDQDWLPYAQAAVQWCRRVGVPCRA